MHSRHPHTLSIFFFQAEDGIRDRNVTGVQTCALPISIWLLTLRNASQGPWIAACKALSLALARSPPAFATSSMKACSRSEERRVGKEWRYRWWTCWCNVKVECGLGSGSV